MPYSFSAAEDECSAAHYATVARPVSLSGERFLAFKALCKGQCILWVLTEQWRVGAFRLCEAFAGGVHCSSVKTGQPLNSEVIIPYQVSVLFHNSM